MANQLLIIEMSEIMATIPVSVRKKIVYIEPVVEFDTPVTDEMVRDLISWETMVDDSGELRAKRVLYKKHLPSDNYEEICFFKSIAPMASVGDYVKYSNRSYEVLCREINLDNGSVIYFVGSTRENCKNYEEKLENATRLYNKGENIHG